MKTNWLVALGSWLVIGCAAKPDVLPTRVENDWVQPKVDEAARAAVRCIRDQPERMVEIEASRDGVGRGWVLPYPAAPAEQECVDHEAGDLHVPPATSATRSIMNGGGQLVEPQGPRARALSLRARAADQLPLVHSCNAAFQLRQPKHTARVALQIEVGSEGEVARAEVTLSTADDAAAQCVLAAARALKLPAIPGTYRFSYWLTPREVIASAPDVYPVDPYDLSTAMAGIAPAAEQCLAGYQRLPELMFLLTASENGTVSAARIDRATSRIEERESDAAADACLVAALRTLRLPPFDGGPKEISVPYRLR